MVPIKDQNGHADRINLRVCPQYNARMAKIVGSKRFPFRSPNDIVRYGIDRACYELERRAGLPTMLFRQIEAIKDVLEYEENQLQYMAILDRSQEMVQNLLAAGANDQASLKIAEIRHHIDQMPAGYWKSRYQQELLTRFGHLLRVIPGEGASLGDVTSNEE